MPKMTDSLARETAQRLLLCYPNLSNADPRIIASLTMQLITLLSNEDESVAREVLHPETGLPGRYEFLSAFTLNQWLRSRGNRPSVSTPVAALPPPPEEPKEPLSEAEKDRVEQVMALVRSSLRASSAEQKRPLSGTAGKTRPAKPPLSKEELDTLRLKSLKNNEQSIPYSDIDSADALT